jgi:hypothetical protein
VILLAVEVLQHHRLTRPDPSVFSGELSLLVGTMGNPEKLGSLSKDGDSNKYMIIARGAITLHILSRQTMFALVDDNPVSSKNVSGLFGMQVEGTPANTPFATCG